ncbi:DNA polymerase I [Myxococcota bacterium]|nr:DNA polymerase I [Myxococcota bacterium]MBU1432491.1 DNA polymerase I [Myxococcota bacterium]MBU1899277.1 DNA polymerase I [Myxococcota bacterium]
MSETLYLIDGSGFIYRAYFGIRSPMNAEDGTPTNAVFGFTQLILNVIKEAKPSHVAVVFDADGPTFRHEIYPQYKANRPPPPDDLIPQFALCRRVTEALGIPAIELAGFEADDIMGTLARLWSETGRDCVLVTADKDLLQLVRSNVTVWDGKEKRIDIDGVLERFGVPPERVVDVLGLAGDTSDNIPGVPGIGEKTAATLLGQYGDLDKLLAAAPTIKGKRGQSLIDYAERARLSARLAQIRLDVPIELDEAALLRKPHDPDVLTPFLRQLNFNRFLKMFDLEGHGDQARIDRGRYRLILSQEALIEVVAAIRAAGRLSLDLETTSLSPLSAQIVGFALAWAPGEAAYVPVAHEYLAAPKQLPLALLKQHLGPIIEDPRFPKVGQNVKYEWAVLKSQLGLTYRGFVGDSIIAAHLLDPNRQRYSLDELSMDYLGHKMISFSEVAGAEGQFARVDVDLATRYAAEDADVTLRLCDLLLPKIDQDPQLKRLNEEMELPLISVVAEMEALGVRIDPERLQAQSARFATEIAALEVEIFALAGGPFKIGSPKQLGEILFERLGLPASKKKKTGYSTDQSVLEELRGKHPLPDKILVWRHLSKLKGTYLDTLPALIHPKTGRVHTSFRQSGTSTGRFSSADPNLQNIPVRTPEGRAIREAFIAAPGWKLLSADYSQVELRLLAHYSKDPGLLRAFKEGADVHRRTAAEIFGVMEPLVSDEQRRQAKAINFGLMYGMGPYRLAQETGLPFHQAKAMIEVYFARYSGVKRYVDEALEHARKHHESRTWYGRPRPLPQINASSRSLRGSHERLAINTPIQGTAADILKIAMLNLHRRLKAEEMGTRMLLTVHDELVLEVPEAELERAAAVVKAEMEGACQLQVPLLVEMGIGDNWAEIH